MRIILIKPMTPVRRTTQRQTVLRTVKFATGPLTADEVVQAVRRTVPGVGLATVYRNLRSLVSRGELYQVESQDGVRRFVGHTFHTALFTCQRCTKAHRLTSQTLPAYVDRKMFGDQVVTVSQLSASGLCAACAKKIS